MMIKQDESAAEWVKLWMSSVVSLCPNLIKLSTYLVGTFILPVSHISNFFDDIENNNRKTMWAAS